ncbi:MAG: hypothetical protein HN952_07925 [Candidatus Cloacimonetes bacterium]|jgi:hypothetical protein|nr:hypothetical protein [Candidatus Cloacimonadota bacterium]MBT6994860.1 hypothetical protein [Candidatus Cloacimonadota bacterium]MBT7468795.1 hypothetical protein [Candidatus Cloacimonadota bacterium]
MLRTNLNTVLIVLVLALLGVAGLETYSQIQRGRQDLGTQSQRMGAFEKQNKKNIEKLQNAQRQLLAELNTQNQLIVRIETALNENIANSNSQIEKLVKNFAENSKKDQIQNKNYQKQLAELRSEMAGLNTKQNRDFNEITLKILSLNDTIFSNDQDIKEFISEYGTRKMRKNIEINEVDTFTVQNN